MTDNSMGKLAQRFDGFVAKAREQKATPQVVFAYVSPIAVSAKGSTVREWWLSNKSLSSNNGKYTLAELFVADRGNTPHDVLLRLRAEYQGEQLSRRLGVAGDAGTVLERWFSVSVQRPSKLEPLKTGDTVEFKSIRLEVRLGSRLGAGSLGVVFEGTAQGDHEAKYAVKVSPLDTGEALQYRKVEEAGGHESVAAYFADTMRGKQHVLLIERVASPPAVLLRDWKSDSAVLRAKVHANLEDVQAWLVQHHIDWPAENNPENVFVLPDGRVKLIDLDPTARN